jgi:adhesin/invasin
MVPQPLRRLVPRFPHVALTGIGLSGLIAVSCQTLPLLAPSGSTLTLVPAANSLQVNGAIVITATVLQGALGTGTGTTTTPSGVGQPVHDDTEVTFTTTLGTIKPATAKTHNGQAAVQLVGDGRSGAAKVTAISGAATSNVTINVGSASATRIAVTASPQSLSATGGTSAITAVVQDAGGVGVSGVPVTFSTTAGTIGTPTVTTNDSGSATTSLTTTQAAIVSASAGTAALTGTVTLTLNPKATVSVTPPGSVTVSQPAVFTIAPIATPVITAMSIDYGDGRSQNLSPGTTSATHFYGSSQVFTVIVTVTDATGAQSTGAAQLAVGPLSASATSVPTTITAGTPASFTVAPSSTAAFIDHYEWDFGDGSAVQITSGGTNSHTYAAPGTPTIVVKVVPQVGAPISVPIAIKVS